MGNTANVSDNLPLGITVSYASIMGVILIGAILGNILVLIAVYSTLTLRTTAAILVVNLACVDFLIAVTIVPFVATTAIAQKWILTEDVCIVTGFINAFLTAAQIMALLHISVNRFMAVARPHSYKSSCNKKATIVMVFAGWVNSIVWTSLPFWGWGKLGFVEGTLFCNILWEKEQFAYALTVQVVCYLIPPSIAAVLYLLVYVKVRSQAKRTLMPRSSAMSNGFRMTGARTESREDMISSGATMNSTGMHDSKSSSRKSKRRTAMENRVTKTLLAVALAFVICWIPRGIANLWALFKNREAVPRALEYASTAFVFLNSAVNPLLYGAFHRDFGKAFKAILCCRGQGLSRNMTRTDNQSADP